jgi:uncharacterized protein YbjT (DUF2867 family)
MKERTAIILGATGLVGSHLLDLLLADDYFNSVRILVRKPISLSNPKLKMELVNFDDENDYEKKLGAGDSLFCCIGTTNKKVKGNKEAYRKVDYQIPVNAAKFSFAAGCRKYLLVSAVGANARSSNFYLRLKGETENAIVQYRFEAVHLFRPSILLGKRNEPRRGEALGKSVMNLFSFLLIGNLRKYRPIAAIDVAKSMLAAAKTDDKGVFIETYAEMQSRLKVK